MLHIVPESAPQPRPEPYSEAVARLATVRHALRLVDPFAGPASDIGDDEAIAEGWIRADDQPQPKIIDVFISKLRKKLRNASGGAEFIETIPQRGWILRDIDTTQGA